MIEVLLSERIRKTADRLSPELREKTSEAISKVAAAFGDPQSPESLELAKIWLAKAQSDLATARLLIKGKERYLDTGSYHC